MIMTIADSGDSIKVVPKRTKLIKLVEHSLKAINYCNKHHFCTWLDSGSSLDEKNYFIIDEKYYEIIKNQNLFMAMDMVLNNNGSTIFYVPSNEFQHIENFGTVTIKLNKKFYIVENLGKTNHTFIYRGKRKCKHTRRSLQIYIREMNEYEIWQLAKEVRCAPTSNELCCEIQYL